MVLPARDVRVNPAGTDGDETPDLQGAFPRLEGPRLDTLASVGQRLPTRAGEVLYRAGEPYPAFHVVLAGTVASVEDDGGSRQVLAVHGPGRFLGDLNLLTGAPALLTGVVQRPGEVLAVPVDRLRELVGQDPGLSDLLLRAYLLRRSMLIELGAGVRVVGSRLQPDTHRLLEFCARNRIPHRWLDLEEDAEAERLVRAAQVGVDATPLVIVRGRHVLRNPRNVELAALLGLRPLDRSGRLYDLVVVGAGPAGLAAAVYGASEGLDTLVLDKVGTGGQAGTSSRIENYLGFPSGVSGAELAERAVLQAEKFGARLAVPVEAAALDRHGHLLVVLLRDGGELTTRCVVAATGARYRKLLVPDLERFEGAGVYYAATEFEARLCRSDPVAVVGGGNSAGQAALFLSRRASQVHLLIRHAELTRDMSRYLADRIEREPRIAVSTRTEVRALAGEHWLERITVRHGLTGEHRELPVRALFVFIGARPCTGWLAGRVAMDDHGFVLTGPALPAAGAGPAGSLAARRHPDLLATDLPGVFAVGDVRSGSIKRVASAVGDGSIAVRHVHDHLAATGAAMTG